MRLFGIRIDDVRDIFGAPPEVAEALTRVFAQRYPAPVMKRRWGLFRRNPDLEVDPSRPLMRDASTLLEGGFVPQERLGQCWEVLLLWLEHLADPATRIEYRRLDSVEFDLARRGLPSTLSVTRLGKRPLGIPLMPLAGMQAGYGHRTHAAATREALGEIDPETLDEATREVVTPLLEFLRDLSDEKDVVVGGAAGPTANAPSTPPARQPGR